MRPMLSLIVLAAFAGLSWPQAASAAVDTPTAQTQQDERAAALAERLRALLAGRCPSGSEEVMLQIISENTVGVDIEVIAAALLLLNAHDELCPSARAAIAASYQAAQLALASSTSTGATGGAPGAPGIPFGVTNVGAPGGGGGPDYVQN